MSWFKKKNDPISDRERFLNEEIAQLEAEIRKLEQAPQAYSLDPRAEKKAVAAETVRSAVPDPGSDPIFEPIDQGRLIAREEAAASDQYNDLGVRKYDLPALLRRVRNHFRSPSTTNPKLVSYLAAGGIQGLRPTRYEKRIERNRFIALVIFLFLMLLGIILVFIRRN